MKRALEPRERLLLLDVHCAEKRDCGWWLTLAVGEHRICCAGTIDTVDIGYTLDPPTEQEKRKNLQRETLL